MDDYWLIQAVSCLKDRPPLRPRDAKEAEDRENPHKRNYQPIKISIISNSEPGI